jgi:DNA-binding response OmpR family regulator
MLKIIIVEDHSDLRESLLDVMAADGHHAEAFDSAEALWCGGTLHTTDIMILDLNLPGQDGIAVARRVREDHPDIGIVMLTARGKPEERCTGYDSGADIYLTKPSSAAELSSSVQALARRLSRSKSEAKLLVLDMIAMTLSGPDGTVALTSAEVELLAAFARAPNRRLDTAQIVRLLASSGEVSKAAIEVRIVRLRKKLDAAGVPGRPINVVRNVGYQLAQKIDLLREDVQGI